MLNKIFIDMDGVLADFVGGAALFHKKDRWSVVTSDITECWNMPKEDFWKPLGYDFWVNLPKTEEADYIIGLCEEELPSENIAILTSPCKTNGCSDGKREWINKHFPKYKKRILMGSAKHFCASPDALLIDDSDDKIAKFVNAGGEGFLYPRPWNCNKHSSGDKHSLYWLQKQIRNLKSKNENQTNVSVNTTDQKGDPRFKKVLDDMWDMHCKKSADYGSDEDIFSNLKASEDYGVPAWLGTVIRLNDKISRLKTFAKKRTLENESVRDSFIDAASYSILASILYEEENQRKRACTMAL